MYISLFTKSNALGTINIELGKFTALSLYPESKTDFLLQCTSCPGFDMHCIWLCHCIYCKILGISSDGAFFFFKSPMSMPGLFSMKLTDVCFNNKAMVVLNNVVNSNNYIAEIPLTLCELYHFIIIWQSSQRNYCDTALPKCDRVRKEMIWMNINDMDRVEEVKLVPMLRGRRVTWE